MLVACCKFCVTSWIDFSLSSVSRQQYRWPQVFWNQRRPVRPWFWSGTEVISCTENWLHIVAHICEVPLLHCIELVIGWFSWRSSWISKTVSSLSFPLLTIGIRYTVYMLSIMYITCIFCTMLLHWFASLLRNTHNILLTEAYKLQIGKLMQRSDS